MVPYEEKSTVTEGAKRPTQVLGILQIIKGNSYSTSRKLRVVDLNPKTAISPFETTVVWEYNLPEIMYQGGLFSISMVASGRINHFWLLCGFQNLGPSWRSKLQHHAYCNHLTLMSS